jgi:hypothetical protein
MELKIPNNLFVKWTDEKGYGVFTDKFIKEGEYIETFYCVRVSDPISNSLYDYVYAYPKTNSTEHVLALGFGSIYNHDDDYNAMWFDSKIPYHFNMIAQKDINIGDEICTYYGDNYWSLKNKRDGR